jgi:uncharacterized protein YukE
MAGANEFTINPAAVGEAISKFAQQKSFTEQSQGVVKAFGPKVISGWIGGDADEFNQDIGRKLMPKYAEFALAFTGIQANLTKSTETAEGSDKKSAGLAQGFADLCGGIF